LEDRINSTSRRCVDCLVVKKVYDAFSRRECLENLPFEIEYPDECTNDYTFIRTEFGKATIENYESEPFFTEIDECHSKLKMVVGVPVYAVIKRNCDNKLFRVCAYPKCSGTVQRDNIVRFPVDASVYTPRQFLRQGRFEPYVESLVETGCANLMQNATLVLTLGFFFIIKVVTDVTLKIPNFGYCDAPEENNLSMDQKFCEVFLDDKQTPFPTFFPDDCK